MGDQQGKQNRQRAARACAGYTEKGHPNIGTAFLHTVIDDHSRVAYVEICTDEKAVTAIGVLERAVAWFADRGVTVERVLSDIQDGWAAFERVRRPAGRIGVVRHPPVVVA